MLLAAKIGVKFDATVTGASDKGVWVRLFHPPVEGKLQRGAATASRSATACAWSSSLRRRGPRPYRFWRGEVSAG